MTDRVWKALTKRPYNDCYSPVLLRIVYEVGRTDCQELGRTEERL